MLDQSFDEDRMSGAQDSGTDSSNPDIDMLGELSQGRVSPSPSTPSTPIPMILLSEPPPSPSTPSTDGLLTDMPIFPVPADPDTPEGGASLSSASSTSSAATAAASSSSSQSSTRGEGRSESSRSRYRLHASDDLAGVRRSSDPFVDESKSGGLQQDQGDHTPLPLFSPGDPLSPFEDRFELEAAADLRRHLQKRPDGGRDPCQQQPVGSQGGSSKRDVACRLAFSPVPLEKPDGGLVGGGNLGGKANIGAASFSRPHSPLSSAHIVSPTSILPSKTTPKGAGPGGSSFFSADEERSDHRSHLLHPQATSPPLSPKQLLASRGGGNPTSSYSPPWHDENEGRTTVPSLRLSRTPSSTTSESIPTTKSIPGSPPSNLSGLILKKTDLVVKSPTISPSGEGLPGNHHRHTVSSPDLKGGGATAAAAVTAAGSGGTQDTNAKDIEGPEPFQRGSRRRSWTLPEFTFSTPADLGLSLQLGGDDSLSKPDSPLLGKSTGGIGGGITPAPTTPGSDTRFRTTSAQTIVTMETLKGGEGQTLSADRLILQELSAGAGGGLDGVRSPTEDTDAGGVEVHTSPRGDAESEVGRSLPTSQRGEKSVRFEVPRIQMYIFLVALQVLVCTVSWRIHAARRRARQSHALLHGSTARRRREASPPACGGAAHIALTPGPPSPAIEKTPPLLFSPPLGSSDSWDIHSLGAASIDNVPGGKDLTAVADIYGTPTSGVRVMTPRQRFSPARRVRKRHRLRHDSTSAASPMITPFWGERRDEGDVEVGYFRALSGGPRGSYMKSTMAVAKEDEEKAGILLGRARSRGSRLTRADRRRRSLQLRRRASTDTRTSEGEEVEMDINERSPPLFVSGEMPAPSTLAGTVHEWIGTGDNLLALVPEGHGAT